MTYNGEIYNFMELRNELEKSGVQFRSVCDTEVILAGWAREGPQFLDRLRGMFALAIWDSVPGKAFSFANLRHQAVCTLPSAMASAVRE